MLKMRFEARQRKCMFNKRLMAAAEALGAASQAVHVGGTKKEPRMAALRSLTGRRQTKWLQPLGKNPDHWMRTVNARKA
jgi:hypothetical protein